MSQEPKIYRAQKWVLQKVTRAWNPPNQHEKLQSEDWDALIILDACRLDTLKAVTNWPISACYSPGSATADWLESCKESEVLKDTYIATANPNYASFQFDSEQIEHVWEEQWDDALGNVPPEPVLDAANRFIQEGKLPTVAHILPPHGPYIAELGGKWFPTFPELDVWRRNPSEDREHDKISPQVAMATGQVDMTKAIEAYRASVESTWNSIKPYISKWAEEGLKIVVTADHGETFGRFRDWKLYGHPNKLRIKPLVEVPWVVFPGTTVFEGDGTETTEEKLEALGYID